MIGSDERMEIGHNLNQKDDTSSNSSESSFISGNCQEVLNKNCLDSDSDGEDNIKAKKDNVRVAF